MSCNHEHNPTPSSCAHFIGGRFVEGIGGNTATFDTLAPATDEKLCSVAHGGQGEIAVAVEAAATALTGDWSRFSASDRGRLLRRIGDLIEHESEALARLESLDTGKPLSETLHGDIPRTAKNFHFYGELAAHQSGPTYRGDDGTIHTVYREPLGIVGLITPWNLPLYLATWKLAPALAQGNTVVLKPAELTPLSANALAGILQEAGVPPGVVNIVQGYGPGSAGEALVRHPEVRGISFTGETTTGAAIMSAAAPSLKKLSFELGGKGASVIFADADLTHAAKTAVRAAFRNQGQVCLAGSRLLVEKSVLDRVMDTVLTEIKKIKVGDPFEATTTMGSLISREHRDRVASFVELARGTSGCEIVCGGKIPAHLPAGAFYEPTVIVGVDQASRLIQEEIFGPVLTVQTFSDEAEAMRLLNGTPYGLSCSIFTRDTARASRTTRAAKFGMVWHNDWFLRELHTPFGGMKRSGVGREGGQYSLDFFSEFKTVTTAAPAPLA